MEDANFDRSVANQAISYLFVEENWIRDTYTELTASPCGMRQGDDPADMLFMDLAVNNDLDYLIEATHSEFSKMCYREGLHRCWFDLIILRDMYRDWAVKCGVALHATVTRRLLEALVVMMSPIIPHWCEHIWMAVFLKPTSVTRASWPVYTPYNKLMRKQMLFFNNFMKNIRQHILKSKIPANATTKEAQIYISSKFDPKKEEILKFMSPLFDTKDHPKAFPSDLIKTLQTFIASDVDMKKDTKVSY